MILEHTTIGEAISQVEDISCENFYKRYLHDFVRLAHKCNHKNPTHESQEYEVIINIMDFVCVCVIHHCPMCMSLYRTCDCLV